MTKELKQSAMLPETGTFIPHGAFTLSDYAAIIHYGKELIKRHLTKGTGGNLSIYNHERGLMLITPSGIPYDELEARDLVVLNQRAEIVHGYLQPSSEYLLHLALYQARKDMRAVIHAHTTYATIFALLREKIPATHYMIAIAGGEVNCADYATFGTAALAKNALQALGDRQAVLLANHGMIAGSADLKNAFNIIEEVEWCAELNYRARSIGQPHVLDAAEMAVMAEKFKVYGKQQKA